MYWLALCPTSVADAGDNYIVIVFVALLYLVIRICYYYYIVAPAGARESVFWQWISNSCSS